MNTSSLRSIPNARPRNDGGADPFDSERPVVRLADLGRSLTCPTVGRISGGQPFLDCPHGHFDGETFSEALALYDAMHAPDNDVWRATFETTSDDVSSGAGGAGTGGEFASSFPSGSGPYTTVYHCAWRGCYGRLVHLDGDRWQCEATSCLEIHLPDKQGQLISTSLGDPAGVSSVCTVCGRSERDCRDPYTTSCQTYRARLAVA